MAVLYKTEATFVDGTVVKDTADNPHYCTAAELAKDWKREFGDQLKSIVVTDVRSGVIATA